MKFYKFNFNNKEFTVNLRSQADKSVLKEIFELGEYEAAKQIIKSAKDPIIDAGAQAGFFCLYCRSLNEKVPIYAIEPDENNLQAIEDNLSLNSITNVKIIPAAVAGQSGLPNFYISSDTHNHSLFKNLTPQINKITKIRTFSLAGFLNNESIQSVSLLKLDIEGAEYEVLQNFSNWSKINNLILEYHDFGKFNHLQLENLLQKNGYKIKTTSSKFEKSLGFIIAQK